MADALPPFNGLEHAYPTWFVPVASARHQREMIIAIIPNFDPLQSPWCEVDCSREEAEVSCNWMGLTPRQAKQIGRALVLAAEKSIWDTRSLAEKAGIYTARTPEEFLALGLALQAAANVASGETPIDWKLWARLNDQQHRRTYERESAWLRKARELLGHERYCREVLGVEPSAKAARHA